MKTAICTLVVTLLLLSVFCQVAGQEKPDQREVPASTAALEDFDFWMNVKLAESQKLFAALAKADFETLTTSSETLETLSAVEGFVRRRTPGYRTHLRSFEFAVNEIRKQSKQENIEGATLGFQQLTLSCVRCHNEIREGSDRPTQQKLKTP